MRSSPPPASSKSGIHDEHVDITIQDPSDRIKAYIDSYSKACGQNTFDSSTIQHTKLISTTLKSASTDGMESRTVFEIPVRPEFCSALGTMHGGCTATLVDNCTTIAGVPLAKEGFWDAGGVSRTLNVTYLRPIPKGSTLLVECIVRSLGRTMAAMQCIVRDKQTGKALALGEHGKVAMQSGVPRNKTEERL